MRKILVTGGRGQLGRGIARRAEANGCTVVALGRDELDVTVSSTIEAAMQAHAPDVVIHAASFTAVDQAEAERDRAHAVNTVGVANVATACAGVPFIYVSTDYVFDGRSSRAYREDDATAPLNVYGATKLGGEIETRRFGGTIVRTSWLFGEGGPSFVHAIAKRAREHEVLRVVNDQVGNPTWADDLADALLTLAKSESRGEILHICGTEPVSRHAFAEAIVKELRGPIACERIDAVASTDFPTPAVRPAFAPLDTSKAISRGLPIRSWREGLRAMLEEIAP
ncbi:dTDP-4-dehydrorhamnose reductase [soil metagenome]